MIQPDDTTASGVQSPLLSSAGLAHVFGDRALAAPLDVGQVLGQPETRRLALVRQVHGARCVREELTLAGEVEADGVGSEDSRVAVGVVTADCVPILAGRVDGRRVVAIHAGWRGLLAGVIEAGVDGLGSGAGLAGVGSCLCAEHFEVGPEVAERFSAAGFGARVKRGSGDRSHVDLRAAVGDRLAELGLEHENVGACTYCEPARWFSYRRDVTHGGAQRTGRLLAIIAPRAK